MADVTVQQLADNIGTPVDRLLKQMGEAGLKHSSAEDAVTDSEKQKLLTYLKTSHGGKAGEPNKITLKRKVTTQLKAGSGSGKGKTVNIEVRKKRTYMKRDAADSGAVAGTEVKSDEQLRREEEQRKLEEAQQRLQEEKRAAEESARRKVQEEEERKAAETTKAEPAEVTPAPGPGDVDVPPDPELEAKKARHKAKKASDDATEERRKAKKPKAAPSGKQERGKGSRHQQIMGLMDDEGGSGRRRPKRKKGGGPREHQFQQPTAPLVREVKLGENINVQDLAHQMSVKPAEVVKILFKMGVMATINQVLDQDTAILVVEEMGHRYVTVSENAMEEDLDASITYEGEPTARAPVVTVMGHVDHGKTSLLDYIRRTKVAAGESGGITQHIGAYHVETDHGMVTFLDTPGHEAFTAMRARGARSTDVVILVVAADDGVMPQTEEAVQHAKAGGVPIVVAVNKMDKEGADPERVISELAAKNVVPEEWGGDTQFIRVSAHTGEGIDALIDAVLLQAEVLELKAYAEGPAKGVVIESKLDKGRGAVSTLLVQNGLLKQGDIVLAGDATGRVRALVDEAGRTIESAGPSIPVEILGLDGTPEAGEEFVVVDSDKQAREVAEHRRERAREQELAKQQAAKLDNLFAGMGAGEVATLNIVLKADVRGSLEAIQAQLAGLGNEEVRVNVVSGGVGGISESDANLAVTANAVMLGFNVRATGKAREVIERNGLDLRYYNVIYDLLDDIKAALNGMLSPELREQIVGLAEVRDVFNSPKFGQVAGCMVVEGTVYRNKNIRVLRDDVVIYEGELESLRRFKDDVQEVRQGTECGIGVRNYKDVKAGDKIEVFDVKEFARTID
ncbi:translation initiation factor IF-2 [Natronospirillum operosum]|uniref:Translation initiation factor IF-2 n=1 Tax=Natronospirillum operosum TaxID=2759953 RepID=A0A4Z0WHP4_9GAMM|nr:translation initiation factor IF-2 [Natronospirillum operosum]TGG94120.1 translation initiation factor IF-2 [Natronospirillum operosum]